MDSWSIQKVKPGLPQQLSWAFEAKSMKVAVELKESNFSDSVKTALDVGPFLVCPNSPFAYSETPKTYFSPNLLYKEYFMLPLLFSYLSVIGPQPLYSEKPYTPKNI